MTAKQKLQEEIKILEKKIMIYSERDWLETQANIAKLQLCDMKLLDMMNDEELLNA